MNDTRRLTPAIVIFTVVAGLALFGFLYWKSASPHPSSTGSQPAAPTSVSSVVSELTPPIIDSSTPTNGAMQQAVKFAVTPAETKVPLGENNVDVLVKMAGSQALSGGVVTLIYNPSIIEVMGVYPVKAPAPFNVTPRIDNAQGWVSVSLTPTGARPLQNPGGGLFTVQFMPIDTGRSEVALMAGSFSDAKGSSIPIEVNNGVVDVFIRE